MKKTEAVESSASAGWPQACFPVPGKGVLRMKKLACLLTLFAAVAGSAAPAVAITQDQALAGAVETGAAETLDRLAEHLAAMA